MPCFLWNPVKCVKYLIYPLFQEMSSIDRANLIDDSFALAKAGYVHYKIPFNLVSYLENGLDKDYAPWYTALVYYSQLKNLLYVSEDAAKDLKVWKHFRSVSGSTF